MTGNRRIVVFAGPSVRKGDLPDGLEADIRAPAAQGDIVSAVLQYGDCVIGLIDGIFQGAPAVRHKEVLWAMDQGATVFGAASMGALRAAELARYGMAGRGLIFRWYRRFALAPDDAVAVLHAPAEIGAAALTEALIDLRFYFKQARRSGCIDRDTERLLLVAANELHYCERSLSAVLHRVSDDGLKVHKDLFDRSVSQKQKDALTLLRELRDRQASNTWPAPLDVPEFCVTDAFLQDLEEGGISLDTHSTN